MILKIYTFTLIILLIPIKLFAQIEEKTPNLLFTISYNYFPQHGAEDISAAYALEYHDYHLYLAFEDKVLKLDMQGNVIGIIYPNKMVRIRDIVFYQNELIVFAPQSYDKLTFYQDSTQVRALYTNFYASNEEELMKLPKLPFYFEAARYLISANDQLYFNDGYKFFPFSYLTPIVTTTYKPLIGKNVFINAGGRKPTAGYPISDCEIVEWSFDRKLPLNRYNLSIVDPCNGTANFISKPLTTDTCESCIISITSFFKNNYLNNYFFYGGFIPNRGLSGQADRIIVFLDENFDVEKMCYSIEYLQDKYGPSPKEVASFTYDELGNVYFCTNYLDYSNKYNSQVKIYKIKY